jgi:hypothetical protein
MRIHNGGVTPAISADQQFLMAWKFISLMGAEYGIARVESSVVNVYLLFFGGEYQGSQEGVSLEHAVLLKLDGTEESFGVGEWTGRKVLHTGGFGKREQYTYV